jgi:hypothetical protein
MGPFILCLILTVSAWARQEKIQWNYTDASGEKLTCQGLYDPAAYSERQARELVALSTWQLPEVYQPLCGRFNDEIASDKRSAQRAKLTSEKETAMQEFDSHIERLQALKASPQQERARNEKIAWAKILKEISGLLYEFLIQGNSLNALRGSIGEKLQDPKCVSLLNKISKLDGDARCTKVSGEWTKCVVDSLGPSVDFGGQSLNEETLKKTLGNATCKPLAE